MLEWLQEAECRGSDPELFFPQRPDAPTILLALQLCCTCRVRTKCYDVAVNNPNIQGIWGGTTQKQRLQLTRRLK